jgi:hypothetical protein
LFDRNRGHIDDPPPALLHHLGNGFPGHNDGAHQIQTDSMVPEVIIDFEESLRGARPLSECPGTGIPIGTNSWRLPPGQVSRNTNDLPPVSADFFNLREARDQGTNNNFAPPGSFP